MGGYLVFVLQYRAVQKYVEQYSVGLEYSTVVRVTTVLQQLVRSTVRSRSVFWR